MHNRYNQTKLLVSVRSADEAAAALAGGADVIDVKEPGNGSLGAADPSVITAVVESVLRRRPVSIALGELSDWADDRLLPLRGGALIAAVKIGLAGQQTNDWPQSLEAIAALLPVQTNLVAVAYADHHAAASPPPEAVLEVAIALGLRAFLIDTHNKQAGDLLDAMPKGQVERLVGRAQERGLMVALAGSLQGDRLAEVARLGPTLIGVRGAACDGDRKATIRESAVRRIKTQLDSSDQEITP